MNDNDILGLLIYANELDGRHAPNEAKVYAWKEVLDDAAPGMPLAFARDVVRRHYGLTDAMVSPAIIVKAWNDNRRAKSEAAIALSGSSVEAHCGMKDCRCTHAEPCFKGWFDNQDNTVTPCPICRRSLSEVLHKISPLGMRSAHEYTMIRQRNYEGVDHG